MAQTRDGEELDQLSHELQAATDPDLVEVEVEVAQQIAVEAPKTSV